MSKGKDYVLKVKKLPSGGARGSKVSKGTALPAGKERIRFPMASLVFAIDIILPGAL
jgi:hypothetical protein